MSREATDARSAPFSIFNSQLSISLRKQSWLFALLLLVVSGAIIYARQPNFFRPGVLRGNLGTALPLMLLAAGQAVVIIGGGVDLSVGAIVSLANVVLVRALGAGDDPALVLPAFGLCVLAGALAGLVNGLCVAYARFQPIVTTFATSFIFAGLALYVLPSPGGSVPTEAMEAYSSSPLGLPLTIWVAALVLALWALLRATRYGPYLYAVGGVQQAAYVSGVPVALVRLLTYVISGAMAACGAAALVFATGTGSPLVGAPLALSSVVAVVLGGNRLSGGQGGLLGPLLGVVVLLFIRALISSLNIDTWYQTLVDGLIVMLALAGPGIVALARRGQN
ncbi:MAG: ABC transporter permease [Chloroflexales bacterium]|nr:ABC transporter permease [Chloroflexales bacterium]